MKIFTFYCRALFVTVWSGDPFTTPVQQLMFRMNLLPQTVSSSEMLVLVRQTTRRLNPRRQSSL
jgi:hypothetical protein